MLTTPNLGLKKPEANDTVNIADLNYNADVLDEQVVKRIINSGGVPSIQAGLDAQKPAPGTAGRLYVATDTQIIYRDTGTTWQKAGAVKWGDIEGKPASFTPSIHGNEAHEPDLALASDLAAHLADNKPHSNYVPLKTTSDITLYVDAATGNDANPGTQAQPLKTIQAAINKIPQIVNHTVTINVAPGDYSSQGIIFINGFMGNGTITVQGASNLDGSANYLVYSVQVYSCQATIKIIGLRATTTASKAFSSDYSQCVYFQYCSVVAVGNVVGFIASHSFVVITDCLASNRDAGICGYENAIIFSSNNQGTGNTLGLAAWSNSKIGKSGTQPTGTTLEGVNGGGMIS